MAIELGCVHALHVGHAGLILPAVLNPDGIFEDIGSLGQVIQVEVRGRVPGGLVITKSVLILVTGKDVDRFGPASAVILHMNILHVPVGTQLDPDDQFVPHRNRSADW